MKKRILNSNIKKEKLQLDENTERMKDFFGREIERYQKRKAKLLANQRRIEETEKQHKRVEQELKKTQKQNEEYKKNY